MTVKELRGWLEKAWDENADVVVCTPFGEFAITGTIGNLMEEPFFIDCADDSVEGL